MTLTRSRYWKCVDDLSYRINSGLIVNRANVNANVAFTLIAYIILLLR